MFANKYLIVICLTVVETNMLRPSDEEFIEWTKNDYNISKIRNALETYPDLIHSKDKVNYQKFAILVVEYVIQYFCKKQILYCIIYFRMDIRIFT